jgi:exonuclease III
MGIMLLNVQGVRTAGKFALLEDYVLNLKNPPHLIVLNEHWLCSEELKYFTLTGYKTISSFGRKNSNRGGVVILALKNAKFTCKKIATHSIPSKFESCGCDIKIKNASIRVIALYRPSNADSNTNLDSFFDCLENTIEQNLRPDQELMIVGDLNINLLNETDQNSKKLISIMQGYELNHMNKNVPTRVTDHSETLIDHFFSSLQCKNSFETVDVPFSDHRALHA